MNDTGVFFAAVVVVALWFGDHVARKRRSELDALEKRLGHLEVQTSNGFQATAEALRNTLTCSLKAIEAVKAVRDESAEKYLKKTDLN